MYRLHVWVGLNLVKHLDRKTLGLEDITDPGGLSKADHRMVCDYQAPLISRTVGVHIGRIAEGILEAVTVEIYLGRVLVLETV
eukprot:1333582-Amorphochlora_amoeboformis.AAC.2